MCSSLNVEGNMRKKPVGLDHESKLHMVKANNAVQFKTKQEK